MVQWIRLGTLIMAMSTALIAQGGVTSFKPTPADLNDLDHHMVYTWRIDNINIPNQVITEATISIKSISNWDNNPNTLFIHLLDSAKRSGVRSFVDDPTYSTPVPPSKIIDDFANTRYHSRSDWLVAPGTADTFLTSKSFTTRAVDYVYTFTASQLQALNAYVANGKDIALGFDPDCHFYNSGITFTIKTAAVPEPSAVLLLGGGLIGLCVRQRVVRRRRRLSLA